MTAYKNIAITGAAGALGGELLKALLDDGSFNITVLQRPDSTSTFPSSVKVVKADFADLAALTQALQGIDVLVSTVGSLAIGSQFLLPDAAAAAGVKRILPSEFGSNLDNPLTRKLPVFAFKVKLQDKIIELSKTSDLTYTFVYNGAFLDWGLQKDFVIKFTGYKPELINGGDGKFTATTLGSITTAVINVLKHPEETKNRAVYISDIITSQNQVLEIAKRLAPEKPWETSIVSLDDLVAESDRRLAAGQIDGATFIPYLYRAIQGEGYGGQFEKNDNELLGIKGKTEADLEAIIKAILEEPGR